MRSRWFVVLAVVVMLGLAWWFGRSGLGPAPVVPGAIAGAATRADAALPGPAGSAAEPDRPTAPTPADPSCGVGRYLQNKGQLPTDTEMSAALDAARGELVAATLRSMLASPDPQARAAALAMRASGLGLSSADLQACDGDDCSAVTDELQQRMEARQHSAGDDLLALTALARASNQPGIYHLALQTCAHADAPARERACAGLTVERLAELDPDNAVPWLMLADKAQSLGDSSGQANAIHRASLATSMVATPGQLVRLALAHAPATMARGYPRFLLAGGASAIEWGLMTMGHGAALSYCKPAQLVADSNRRDPCERLAKLMLKKGPTALDLGMGLALGKHVGLPAALLDAAQREKSDLDKAAMKWGQVDPTAGPAGGRCVQVVRMTEQIEQIALQGERAAYRAGMH